MSHNKAKRPKVEEGEGGDDCTTMADILAEMQEMKSKLSRMDEMQNEIDSMKGKLSQMDELVSKCKHLEEKCAKLEKSVKLLAKDWKYSVPDIPDSHWEDQGFDEDYIENICDFLEGIKEQTFRLRSGAEIEYISLGFDENGTDVLQHDVALLFRTGQN